MMPVRAISPAVAWQAPGRERPLLCWRGAELTALCSAFDAALGAWAAAWGVAVVAGVSCHAAESSVAEPDEGEWSRLLCQGEPGGWLHVPDDAPGALAVALFAQQAAADTAAAQLALQCKEDARARLFGLLQLSPRTSGGAPPGADACAPWSGAVEIILPSPLGWRLLLQAQVVQGWCHTQGVELEPAVFSPRSALVPLGEALARNQVTLAVRLEGCELELGVLQNLQPGDVVRLQHSIEAPALLTAATGVPLFEAYLGRSGSLKAVELAHAAPAQTSHQEAIA